MKRNFYCSQWLLFHLLVTCLFKSLSNLHNKASLKLKYRKLQTISHLCAAIDDHKLKKVKQ